MKKSILLIVLLIITAQMQAQSKREDRNNQQLEAYNKALNAMKTGYFVFMPQQTGNIPTLDNRTTFILIKGDKGAKQFGAPATSSGLRPISGKEMKVKRNGDVVFKCELEGSNRIKDPLTITLKNNSNTAYATHSETIASSWIGNIIPENEANYILFDDLKRNE